MNRDFVKTLDVELAKVPAVPQAAALSPVRRWRQLMKDAFFFIYLYCGYVQLRDLLRAWLGRSRAVVLYYHRIGASDVLTRTPEQFAEDLDHLKTHYECIGLGELAERLKAGRVFRRRAVVITFDDGYRDNFTAAAPLLKNAGIPATFFVSTAYMGTERDFPHDLRDQEVGTNDFIRFPKLTWSDLRSMEDDGFEIGSHTINHTNMGCADHKTIAAEINGSLLRLNQELGERPRAFSFPWGKPPDISAEAIDAVKRAGYYTAVSAYGGANTCDADLFNLRRVDVGNGQMSKWAMRARVAGFDPDFYRLKLKNRNI
jgi:peptidoglycan/xylan/chitin deacetylase (PgdA/CDA1 family)